MSERVLFALSHLLVRPQFWSLYCSIIMYFGRGVVCGVCWLPTHRPNHGADSECWSTPSAFLAVLVFVAPAG